MTGHCTAISETEVQNRRCRRPVVRVAIRYDTGLDIRSGHAVDIRMTNHRYQPAADATFRYAYQPLRYDSRPTYTYNAEPISEIAHAVSRTHC